MALPCVYAAIQVPAEWVGLGDLQLLDVSNNCGMCGVVSGWLADCLTVCLTVWGWPAHCAGGGTSGWRVAGFHTCRHTCNTETKSQSLSVLRACGLQPLHMPRPQAFPPLCPHSFAATVSKPPAGGGTLWHIPWLRMFALPVQLQVCHSCFLCTAFLCG
jgi:hypothetical protein